MEEEICGRPIYKTIFVVKILTSPKEIRRYYWVGALYSLKDELSKLFAESRESASDWYDGLTDDQKKILQKELGNRDRIINQLTVLLGADSDSDFESESESVVTEFVDQYLYLDSSLTFIRAQLLKYFELNLPDNDLYFFQESENGYQQMNHYFVDSKIFQIPVHPLGLDDPKKWASVVVKDPPPAKSAYDLGQYTLEFFYPEKINDLHHQQISVLLLRDFLKNWESSVKEMLPAYNRDKYRGYYWPQGLCRSDLTYLSAEQRLDRVNSIVNWTNNLNVEEKRITACYVKTLIVHINYNTGRSVDFVNLQHVFQLYPLNSKFVFVRYRPNKASRQISKRYQPSYGSGKPLSQDNLKEWGSDPNFKGLQYKKYQPTDKKGTARFATINIFSDGRIEYISHWRLDEKVDFTYLVNEINDLRTMIEEINKLSFQEPRYKNQLIEVPDPNTNVTVVAFEVYMPITQGVPQWDSFAKLAKCFWPYVDNMPHCEFIDVEKTKKIQCKTYTDRVAFVYKRVNGFPVKGLSNTDILYYQLNNASGRPPQETVYQLLADRDPTVNAENLRKRYRDTPVTIALRRPDYREPTVLEPYIVQEDWSLPGVFLALRPDADTGVYRFETQSLKGLQAANRIYDFCNRFTDIYFRLVETITDETDLFDKCGSDFKVLKNAVQPSVEAPVEAQPKKPVQLTAAQRRMAERLGKKPAETEPKPVVAQPEPKKKTPKLELAPAILPPNYNSKITTRNEFLQLIDKVFSKKFGKRTFYNSTCQTNCQPAATLPPNINRNIQRIDNKINETEDEKRKAELVDLRKNFEPDNKLASLFKATDASELHYFLCVSYWCIKCQLAFLKWELIDGTKCPICGTTVTEKDNERSALGFAIKDDQCFPACYQKLQTKWDTCIKGVKAPEGPAAQRTVILKFNKNDTDRYMWLDPVLLQPLFNGAQEQTDNKIGGPDGQFLRFAPPVDRRENSFLKAVGVVLASDETGDSIRKKILEKLPEETPKWFTNLHEGLLATVFDTSGIIKKGTIPTIKSSLNKAYNNFKKYLADNESVDEDMIWDLVTRPGILTDTGFNLIVLDKMTPDWATEGDYQIKCPVEYRLETLFQTGRQTIVIIRVKTEDGTVNYYPITRAKSIGNRIVNNPFLSQDSNAYKVLTATIIRECRTKREEGLQLSRVIKKLTDEELDGTISGVTQGPYYQTEYLVLGFPQEILKELNIDSDKEILYFKLPVVPQGDPQGDPSEGPSGDGLQVLSNVENLSAQINLEIIDFLKSIGIPIEITGYLVDIDGLVIGLETTGGLKLDFSEPVKPELLPPIDEMAIDVSHTLADAAIGLENITPIEDSDERLFVANQIIFEDEAYQHLRLDLSKLISQNRNVHKTILDVTNAFDTREISVGEARRKLTDILEPILTQLGELVEISRNDYMLYERPQIRTVCYRSDSEAELPVEALVEAPELSVEAPIIEEGAFEEPEELTQEELAEIGQTGSGVDDDDDDFHCITKGDSRVIKLPKTLSDGTENSITRYTSLIVEELLHNIFKRNELLDDLVDIYHKDVPVYRSDEVVFTEEDIQTRPEISLADPEAKISYQSLLQKNYLVAPQQIKVRVPFSAKKIRNSRFAELLGGRYKQDGIYTVERIYKQLEEILRQIKQDDTPIDLGTELIEIIERLDKDENTLWFSGGVGNYYAELLKQEQPEKYSKINGWNDLKKQFSDKQKPLDKTDLALLSHEYGVQFGLLNNQTSEMQCLNTTQSKTGPVILFISDERKLHLIASESQGMYSYYGSRWPESLKSLRKLCSYNDDKPVRDTPESVLLNYDLNLPEEWMNVLGNEIDNYKTISVSGRPDDFAEQLARALDIDKNGLLDTWSNYIEDLESISTKGAEGIEGTKGADNVPAWKVYLEYIRRRRPQVEAYEKDIGGLGDLKDYISRGLHAVSELDLAFFSSMYGLKMIFLRPPMSPTDAYQISCLGTTQTLKNDKYIIVYQEPGIIDFFRLVGFYNPAIHDEILEGSIKGRLEYPQVVFNPEKDIELLGFRRIYDDWKKNCERTDLKAETDPKDIQLKQWVNKLPEIELRAQPIPKIQTPTKVEEPVVQVKVEEPVVQISPSAPVPKPKLFPKIVLKAPKKEEPKTEQTEPKKPEELKKPEEQKKSEELKKVPKVKEVYLKDLSKCKNTPNKGAYAAKELYEIAEKLNIRTKIDKTNKYRLKDDICDDIIARSRSEEKEAGEAVEAVETVKAVEAVEAVEVESPKEKVEEKPIYPANKDITKCALDPNKGGISLTEAMRIAERLGISTKIPGTNRTRLKQNLCADIAKELLKK